MNSEKSSPESDDKRNPLALGVAVAAGVVAMIVRIVPHPPNFSAVGALGLFGGARLRAWQAYSLPLGIMFVSDLALWTLTGFNELYSPLHLSRVYVYASFMIYVAIGRRLCDKDSLGAIALAGVIGGLQFFLITNFCEWLFQPLLAVPEVFRYSRDLNGLAACYLAALGFYQHDLTNVDGPFMLFKDFRLSPVWICLGDVFFTTIYVMAYRKLAGVVTSPAPAPAIPEVQS